MQYSLFEIYEIPRYLYNTDFTTTCLRIKFHQVVIEIDDDAVRARETWSFANDLKAESAIWYPD